MSLDLHGFTVPEALDLFVKHYNSRVDRGDLSRFQVIHGWGSGGSGGRIRTALRRILSSLEDTLQFQTDPVNPGVTIVIPMKRLPGGAGILSALLLEFCSGGKSESKVLGRFSGYGELSVKRTLQQLVKQGRMKASRRGRHIIYTAE